MADNPTKVIPINERIQPDNSLLLTLWRISKYEKIKVVMIVPPFSIWYIEAGIKLRDIYWRHDATKSHTAGMRINYFGAGGLPSDKAFFASA